MVLQRPGHDQCTTLPPRRLQQEPKAKNLRRSATSSFRRQAPKICCHFPATRTSGRSLVDFSHAKHVDPHARVDARTGFRADCTFCHQFRAMERDASFGNHVVCAGCHSKAGMKPLLSEKSTTADCQGCHRPQEIENPGAASVHRQLASYVAFREIRSHQIFTRRTFQGREAYHLDCTTCHYGIADSTKLANLTLPKMADCVNCHDISKTIAIKLSDVNCAVCHIDVQIWSACRKFTRASLAAVAH